jgi:hypothetical protein
MIKLARVARIRTSSLSKVIYMNQQQSTLTNQAILQIAPIDPKFIMQSESLTVVKVIHMNQQQPTLTNQTTLQIALIDPKLIIQSESPTAVILATTILISILVSGITVLVQVIMITKPRP